MVKNGCAQSDQGILKLTHLINKKRELTDFLYAGANSGKLKVI